MSKLEYAMTQPSSWPDWQDGIMSERTPDPLAARHRHVGSGQDRRDEALAHCRLTVDLALQQRGEQERAL